MWTAAFIIGLVSIGCRCAEQTAAEGFRDSVVQSECRGHYLWIHVSSAQTPRFEAVDQNGVYSISEQLASRCGYTISTFKMDGFTTFRASYYSCFTKNQDDEAFSFRFNVMVSDAGGTWVSRPVSAVCSGPMWTQRELICEEDYMEVNVNRGSSCGAQRGNAGDVWHAAFSQAQRTASSVWQLMFLQRDGQVSSMSDTEAQRWGYSLTVTARRVVLRSPYKAPQAEVTMVDGVPVEVVQVSVFFKQKLTVLMLDMTMACTINSGSFDGARLLWDIPLVLSPLVRDEAGFRSQSLRLGVEGVLLDASAAAARGFSLTQQGHLVQIGIPFGAKGGYRESKVVNNVYRESYVIFLLYEHVFSLLYEDGSSIDTRHRMLRVLDSPLLCHPPFSLDQTMSDDQAFSVYLGNIPADVLLEGVQINGKQLVLDGADRGHSISPVLHTNGSRAYELQLPFEDANVDWMYLGQGVVQYSIAVNFTLTIMPRGGSYYHHTFITARVFNAFPPEMTAQCSDRGITFSVVRPLRTESLWEVGIDHEPLTAQLAAQRGYRLDNDTHRTTLEVPVFSVGYTYEDINLSNFYGTFKLLLRDAKTLEVQTSTSKRCLFQTEDMIVCSPDGTMAVVTTLTSTWPTALPDRTTLLDPSCGPKQTDGSKVLYEFRLDSCGTRAMVGESYVMYENEIVHDRQLIADGPNFISRQSQFRLTVRCFYPLSGVGRLSVDRVFTSQTPGAGSLHVFQSVQAESSHQLPAQECLHQVSGNTVNPPSHQIYQTPAAVPPGPSRFIPGRHNQLLYSSHKGFNLYPLLGGQTSENQQVPAAPLVSQNQAHVFIPMTTPSYDQLTDNRIQSSNLNTPLTDFVKMRGKNSGPTEGSSAPRENGLTGPDQDLQSPKERSDMQERTQQHEEGLGFNIYRYSGGGTEEIPGSSQPLEHHPVLQTPAHRSPERLIPAKTKGISSKDAVSNRAGDTQPVSTVPTSAATSQVDKNLERPAAIERRNTETVQSRVQNIRVKPLSKLVSSGHQLIQKPVIQKTNFQTSEPSQYATGPTVSRDGNSLMSQQLPDHRGSNRREEHERRRFSTLEQEQGVHGVQVKSVIQLTDWSLNLHQQRPSHLNPNQPEHQQKPVQSVAETGKHVGPESNQREVHHTTGTSHIRVRPGPSLQGRLQTLDEPKLQNPTSQAGARGETGRTSDGRVTPQDPPTDYPNSNKVWSNAAGLTGAHAGPNGSAGSGSDLQIHTRSDCGSQDGASVHQGIIRGKRIS